MSKKTNVVTLESYKGQASETARASGQVGAKLADIVRNLNASPDFSPCTIKLMQEALTDIEELQKRLKHMVALSVNRGCTHFEEEKQKLLEGTLKLNRRDVAEAAE